MIAAASDNDVIGTGNTLPWSLPDELQRFRQTTAGKPVIMGRKTHESIGRALPGRVNIVVSRDAGRQFDGCIAVPSLRDGIDAAKATEAPEAFIIGGGQIYQEAMPLVDRLYLTRVHAIMEGDTFFPTVSTDAWREVSHEDHAADDRHPFAFTYHVYERRQEG